MKKIRLVTFLSVMGLGVASQLSVAASLRDVVINEIAWMGTTNSSSDEWIELKNTTSQSISLSGWTLNSVDGTPSITLSGSIPAGGFFVLERTDDSSEPGSAAGQIYTGAMGNSGEHLELRDSSNNVIDSVDDWYAGDSAGRATMSRTSDTSAGNVASSWSTSTSSYAVGKGTPNGSNDGSSSGGGGSNPSAGAVVISEIAWMGTTNSASDEWIELRSASNSDVDLTGWTLEAADGTPSISLSGTLSANGYFLLEKTDDNSVPGIAADQIYSGALENGGEHLYLRDDSNVLIDEVDNWHAGINNTKATAERVSINTAGNIASNWATATQSYVAGLGTPKSINGSDSGSGSGATGCNYPTQMEVVSINIGQGDATLIASPTKLLLADAGESYWNSHYDADKIAEVIHERYGNSCNHIDYVVISHIHLDHIGYIQAGEDSNGDLLDENGNSYQEGENLNNPAFLAGYAYLVKNNNFTVGETIVRDYINHNPNPSPANGGSKTYRNWRAHLQSPNGQADFNPVTALLGANQIDMGSVNGNPITIDIVIVDGLTPSNPTNGCDPATYFGGSQYILRGDRSNDPTSIRPSENDMSIGFFASLGDFDVFIGGDLSGENYNSQWGYRYHDIETCLAEDSIVLQNYGNKLDVLRANHHGSSHSTNQAFIDAFAPTVTIFSVGDNNTFGHVNDSVLDRSLAESIGNQAGEVILTEAGASVTQPSDACHTSNSAWCAEISDNEFPTSTETNETGDDGVVITVSTDGSSYTVLSNQSNSARTYTSR